MVFAFALLMVFLVLAALYESWSVPFAVILAIPFGVLGALLAIWTRGLTNDIYFQIGLSNVDRADRKKCNPDCRICESTIR